MRLLFKIWMPLLVAPILSFAQQQYTYTADIKNVNNDQVAVELLTPQIKEAEAIFSFPKAIPGSYSQKDYGRYIIDFGAFDKSGKKLKVKKLNANQYQISNATALHKINYRVNDTWDDVGNGNFIFQPGGSNIEAGKNVVLNSHAFFGYFEKYKMLPFEVKVLKPAEFYGSTNLNVKRAGDVDILSAKDYVSLADNPVLYCKPDTTSFAVGDSKINVSVYSAKGLVSSKQIAEYLKPMSVALDKFFNGLPVDSYQFLYYFEDPAKGPSGKNTGGYGALEHNYSSLYFLPETTLEPSLKAMVNEVSSHEFLHILTPLNLHSEEIENFDFVNPKMSQHLWLYEGVTEYFAHLVQLQNGLINEKEFISNMRRKIPESEKHGSFSMTEMSKNVLSDKFQSKYETVYTKGAITAWLLDLFIREKTNEQKSLRSVIQELAKKYGPSKPFKDERLFTDLVAASHPDVNDFINNYIIGDKPLPLNDHLNRIGYEYLSDAKKNVFFPGNMGLEYDENSKTFSFSKVEKNSLGIADKDVFISVNDTKITSENINDLWEKYFSMNTTDPQLKITVNRAGIEKVLSGPLYSGYADLKYHVAPVNNPNEAQIKNLNSFLGRG